MGRLAWSRLRAPSDAWCVLFLIALCVPLYWDQVRDGRHLSRVDIVTQYLQNYLFLGEALRAGDLPGWNPHVASGMPFLGDAVSGWAYLPPMITFTLLPPLLALQTSYLIHILLAALGLYALARVSGLGLWGATIAAAIYEYGSIVASLRSVNARAHLTAWLPLALLGIELAIRARTLRGRAAGWSLSALALSQMMVGWTGQGSAYALLFVGMYVFLRCITGIQQRESTVKSHIVRHVTDGIAVLFSGLGLAAAGLWIRYAVNQDSLIAGGNYSQALGAAQEAKLFTISQLLTTLLDEKKYYYIGGAALGLAVLAPFVADRNRWRVLLYGLLILIIADLALTPGTIRHVIYLAPTFQELHEHSTPKGFVLLGLPIAMLGGMTVDAITRWQRAWWLLGGLALIPVFLGLDLDRWLRQAEPGLNETTMTMMITVGLALVAFALFMAVRPRLPAQANGIASLLVVGVLLTTIIMDPVGRYFGGPLTGRAALLPPEQVFETYTSDEDPGGPGEFLQQRQAAEGPFRFLGYGPGILASEGSRTERTYHGRFRDELVISLLFSRTMQLGLSSVQGYNPAQSERYSTFLTAVNGKPQNYHDANIRRSGLFSPLLRLLNIRYIIVQRDGWGTFKELQKLGAAYPVVYEDDIVRILEVPDALPYAWIVHRAIEATTDNALSLLQGDGFDPTSEAVIEGALPPLAPADNGAPEQVAIERYSADHIRLSATMSQPGLVVVNEMYAYGWNAYLDGKRTTLYATDYLLRGIAVPAGKHILELRYEPREIRLGIAASLLTMMLLGMLITQPWRLVPVTFWVALRTPRPTRLGVPQLVPGQVRWQRLRPGPPSD